MLRQIRILFKLVKIRISVFAGLSFAAGYLLAGIKSIRGMDLSLAGIILLSAGSLSLNQYQDRKIDAVMSRTKNRPIPSGDISPLTGVIISGVLITAGTSLLVYGGGLTAGVLGLIALLLYNGVYTRLKYKTPFVIIPGSLVGALPPCIGYVSAGGSLTDRNILILAVFFYVWQLPHFWLLNIFFADDYKKAGIPTLLDLFSTAQMSRITFTWIISTGISTLAIPVFRLSHSVPVNYLFLLSLLWITVSSVKLLYRNISPDIFRRMFVRINIYALLVISLLFIDRIIYRLHTTAG